MPKRVTRYEANMVNDNVYMIPIVSDIISMISQVNLVEWLTVERSCTWATFDIKVEGDVILKMTYKEELKLTNVSYVLEIRKNLVSGWLLNKLPWIFKKKMKADGTIDKYKERLFIKGFIKREALEYFDTYSPVT
nr:putative mediator of RNA polymerase II transcription subunit 37c [Tanacetum cinerariifolium]